MNRKILCLELLAAESEAVVQAILDKVPEMKDPKNWVPLDRRETNYNVTTNQQTSGPKAATELMTNMVDAILLKHALLNGTDPRGPKAPKTMYDAVDLFVKNLRGGKLVLADRDWLRDFAEKNLLIGITGAKSGKEGFPCYTFCDNGEGQYPEKFEDTFLSLSVGNKKDIPFVQGKFNMGSSGVLGYCGRKWFKLIVSRKYDTKRPWGWTLLRKRPGGGMPIAEYFKPKSGIPTIEADALFPLHKRNGDRFDGFHLNTGTVVKLYDFQIGREYLSFRGAREALNENLVETILPFRLLDFRQAPDPKRTGLRREGIDPRSFYGMEYLLLRSHRDEFEPTDTDTEQGEEPESSEPVGVEKVLVDRIEDPELGTIEITAIPLKRTLPAWLEKTSNRVFHAVNGQVQYKQTRGFLTQCGFPALKDRIVLIVDASRLSYEATNEVWKADRESVRETIIGERYKARIKEAIEESAVLKDLQQKIAKEELDLVTNEESTDLFQKLVDADPNLATLLSGQKLTIYLPSVGDDKGSKPFKGKYSPTFLKVDSRFKEHGFEIPINKSRPLTALTDAANDYLVRADNKGRLLLPDDFRAKFVVRTSLRGGRLIAFVEPSSPGLKVGDTVPVVIGLQDDAMAAPVSDSIILRIVAADVTAPKAKKPKKPQTPKDQSEPKDQPQPKAGLPPFQLLTRDGRELDGQPTAKWPSKFDEDDGGRVENLGDGQLKYFINYDNAYHLKARHKQRGDGARNALSQKYILGMRILLLGIEHAARQRRKKNGDADLSWIDDHDEEFRRLVAQGAATTVLTIADGLPKMFEDTEVPE